MAHQRRTQQAEALEMLTADHRHVQALFQQYAQAKNRYTKQRLADQACAALTQHAQLEETIFYPAFAHAADDREAMLVEAAFQDHHTVQELIAALEDTPDVEFDARFRALQEHVEAHMQEEEHTMFPKAEALLAAHMVKLAEAMRQCKKQLRAS